MLHFYRYVMNCFSKYSVLSLSSLFVFICFMVAPLAAFAEETDNQIEFDAIVRSLYFIRGMDVVDGNINIAVVYDSSSDFSKNSAQKALHSFAVSGVDGKVKARLVPVQSLMQIKNTQVFYIVGNMDRHFDIIKDTSNKNNVLNVSLSERCIIKNCCAIVVHHGNGLEIFLNNEVMRNNGLDVDAAFKYMAIKI